MKKYIMGLNDQYGTWSEIKMWNDKGFREIILLADGDDAQILEDFWIGLDRNQENLPEWIQKFMNDLRAQLKEPISIAKPLI